MVHPKRIHRRSLLLTPRWTHLRHHPVQWAFWNGPHRFNTIPAGRRSGKTELVKRKLVLRAIAGETDAAFRARIKANLFLPANTRAAVLDAVETVTGLPARAIEPWQPNDTFVWGRSFWGVNMAAHPGQWANGNQRAVALIVCALPLPAGFGGNPRFGWGNWFYGANPALAVASGAWWTQSGSQISGMQLVYGTINRVRPVGVTIFVKFVPAAQLP